MTDISGDNLNNTLTGSSGDDRLYGLGGDDSLLGNDGSDELYGGSGDDFLNPGTNTSSDRLFGGAGNDTISFADAVSGYYELRYDDLNGPITATINGITNTGTVDAGAEGTDTLLDIANPLDLENFALVGTSGDDTFNLTLDSNQWMEVVGGAGSDTFNLSGYVRLSYWLSSGSVVADLGAKTITQDGDTDTFTGVVNELRTGDGNDSLLGSSGNDRFITGGGNDTVDGGAGFDRVRYDRSQMTSGILVDLTQTTGTVTGEWNGVAFSDSLTGIEHIRGTKLNDTLVGSDQADRLEGKDGNDTIYGYAGNDTLEGGNGSDNIIGGSGDDYINPGDNTDYDYIEAGLGNDTIDMSDVVNGFVTLAHHELSGPITVTVDGAANTGSVAAGAEGTDVILGVANALDSGWVNGGLEIQGTEAADTYNIHTDAQQWGALTGRGGNDTFNLTGDGLIRLNYHHSSGAVTADMAAGTIMQDGYTDTVNGSVWELRGGDGDDSMAGSAANESFITQGGDDTVDGRGGFDRVNYDRSGISSGITVDLTKTSGTVLGEWNGVAFSQSLTNIEFIRGTNYADSLLGDDGDNRLEGRGGDDTIEGGKGNDTIVGGAGEDLFVFNAGDGHDTIEGFNFDEDDMDISASGLTEAEIYQVLVNATETSAGLKFDFGADLSITLAGVTRAVFETIDIPPFTEVSDQTMVIGEGAAYRRLNTVLTLLDDRENAITQYEVRDTTGGNNWWADGGFVNSTYGYVTSNLAGIYFYRDDAPSTQTLEVRAFDGESWSEWSEFTLTTEAGAANETPVVTIANQEMLSSESQWRQLKTVMSATDADGDAITKYEIYDNVGGNNWWADGQMVDASTGYVTTNLNGIWLLRDAPGTTQTLSVRAFDGKAWGAWADFQLSTPAPANSLPVVTIPDQVIAMNQNQWRQLSSFMTVEDQDGDTITKYQLRDTTGSDSWWADGGFVDASTVYETTKLSGIWISRDAAGSSQTLSVRAFDGQDWSEWTDFTLSTPENFKPVVTIENQVFSATSGSQWKQLKTVMNITDGNDDAITKYEIYDNVGGNNFWADGGYVDASTGYVTTNLDGIWLGREATPSTQKLWVRAFDGTEWSAWEDFMLTTNEKPVVAIENQTKSLGDGLWTQLKTVMNITDANNDKIAKYEVYDNIGGDNWWADGGYVDASTGYVTENLNGIWFARDDAESSQRLWVRVYDGSDWSDWDSFDLFTVA